MSIAKTLTELGQININLSEFIKAISCYLDSLHLIEKHDLSLNKARILNSIASIKIEINDLQAAQEYLDLAINGIDVKNVGCMGYTLVYYAKLNIKRMENAIAESNLKKSLEIFQTKKDHDGLILTFKTMGNLYHQEKKFRQAITCFEKVKNMLDEEKDTFVLATIQNLLGSTYLEIGEMDKAYNEIQNSLFVAKYYDLKDLMKDNYLKISQYFQNIHKNALALEYYKSYSELKEEIYNEENFKKIAELRLVYELEKKEQQIKDFREQYIHTKEEKNILDSIINCIPHPISIKNLNGEYIKVNKDFADMFNTSPELIVGQNVHELHDDELTKTIRLEDEEIIKNNKILVIEKNNSRFFGEHKSLFITKAPLIIDNKSTGIVSTIIDFTEQKRIQKQLEESKKLLTIKNNEKDKFFSILAHDLKNPLSGMMVTVEYLSKNFAQLKPEKIIKFISNLSVGISNISELLEDLLTWSGAQTGRMEMIPRKLNIDKICQDTIRLLHNVAQNKQIEVINKIEPKFTIIGDRNMVSTIFRNLISNAIKFTFTGGKIKIESFAEDAFNGFRVIDNGQGMTDKQIENVFLISKPTTYTTLGTNKEKGTGLGLPICMEFMKLHNGNIEIESDVGTTFTIRFPKIEMEK